MYNTDTLTDWSSACTASGEVCPVLEEGVDRAKQSRQVSENLKLSKTDQVCLLETLSCPHLHLHIDFSVLSFNAMRPNISVQLKVNPVPSASPYYRFLSHSKVVTLRLCDAAGECHPDQVPCSPTGSIITITPSESQRR